MVGCSSTHPTVGGTIYARQGFGLRWGSLDHLEVVCRRGSSIREDWWMCFVSRLGGRKFRRGTNTAQDGRARKAVTVMVLSTYVGIWAAAVHRLAIMYEHANSSGVRSFQQKRQRMPRAR